MKILVTGSDGFVGINIVKKLLERGAEVVCTSRHPFSEEKLAFLDDHAGRLSFEKMEVLDTSSIEDVFSRHMVDGIIHAAAVTPTYEIENKTPERIMRVNFGGTVNVLEAARRHDVKRFVFVSSNGLYGDISDCEEIIHEDHPNDPDSLYALAKYTSEAYCRRFAKISGMRIVSGRVCSTYGPMEAPTGSRKNMSTANTLITAALEHREIKVVRPEIKRNWTHVYDIAGALVALLYANDPSFSEYNLSAGKNYSLTEVMETIRKYIPDFKFSGTDDPNNADIVYGDSNKRGFLDASRLFNDIGYHPVYDLSSGIKQYIDWLGGHRI